jgi:hypothetical protein
MEEQPLANTDHTFFHEPIFVGRIPEFYGAGQYMNVNWQKFWQSPLMKSGIVYAHHSRDSHKLKLAIGVDPTTMNHELKL